ncbi:MAG: biotin--[acetyl-CoA-carboxylase] ligase [Spirochaetes bacterium]|nr:biotin--[acetyl-CoA-carboxylase] ligase [Spirochaetota bacterium]
MMDSTNDKLRTSKIKPDTVLLGKEIVYYKKTDSTNRVAKELANNGDCEGTLIIADEQTKGRGRLNRNWISAPGTNILMSLVFRPFLPVNKSFFLTMIASTTLVKAIKKVTGLKTLIKWPNDIYCNNKKMSGVLTELNLHHNKIDYAVIGIGLNVNSDLSAVPGIKDTATSIFMERGQKFSRTSLLCSILEILEEEYLQLKQNKFENIRKQWEDNSLVIGKQVIVSSGDYSEFGIAESIAEDGSLVLLNEENKRKNIHAGDVSLRLKE